MGVCLCVALFFCSCKFHLCTSYSVECQLTCACGFSSFLAFCCCSLCFEFQLCTSDSVECEFHSIDGYVTFSEGVPVFILLIVNFRRRIIQKAQRVMPSTWPRSWWQGILVNLPTSSGERPGGGICVELVELHQVGLSSLVESWCTKVLRVLTGAYKYLQIEFAKEVLIFVS